ncbi:SusC/RagA family TonB-linked outer membrane protein [Parafilimonas sp.]|uniref:SusC/RagA family TonB-linked outer membrane protein n=1 Tax=Parafilimonas sp. TaxID=1969739 RepID=UPI0039E55942
MKHLILRKTRTVLYFFTIFICCAAHLHAQNSSVRGRIINEKSEAIPNISILVRGSTNGTTTDENGNYLIKVPDSNAVLVFSSIGYETQEIKVGAQATINVTLKTAEAGKLSEVVVVGYGTQKKVTVTGAVAQVKGADLEKSRVANLSNSLAGRLPGITAIQSSGEPGYDGSTIRIRGTNTLGNSSALIVIDGIPDRVGGFDRLNPADIESFSVLKDASAAIYGARAANGVILVTTKRGKSGKPSLYYEFNQGWAQPTVIPKMMNATQYATVINELNIFDNLSAGEWADAWEAFQTTGVYTSSSGDELTASYSPDDMQKYADGSDPWGHPNTDWFHDVLKTWSPQSKHGIQISGGTDAVKYLASLGYTNQDGYYRNSATGYKQYDMRVNLDVKVNRYINFQMGLSGREEYRFFPTESAGSIFRMLMRGKPTAIDIWPNGLPGPDIENGQNPVVITTNQTGYDRDKRDYFQTNGKVEINIPGVEGLKLSGTASLDKTFYNTKEWQTPWYLYFWDGSSYEDDGITPLLTKSIRSTYTDPRLTLSTETDLSILLGGMLNYDKKIGNHTINLLAAVTKETINSSNFWAFRRNYISPAIDQLFFGGDDLKDNSGGGYERARLSYFGRVAYNYKEKYLAEFLWRYDGSYIFPPDSRFGFFPGILAGWNISQENFFQDNVKFINYLKLRASYGQMGNDQVYYNDVLQEYQYLSTYGASTTVLNDAVQQTLYESVLANPNFTWERAKNFDVGLEGSMLNSRISFEFDYFHNRRTEILWQRSGSTPASAGITLPPENFGIVSNQGWEFKIGYSGSSKDFTYSISVNGGYAKNKIVYYDESQGAPYWQYATGKGFGTSGANFLSYLYDGVFKDQADIDKNTIDYSGVTNALKPGDMKLKDIGGVDADGNPVLKPDGKIDGYDQIRLDKNRDPRFTGGINVNLGYKGFDLTILLQGATGGLLFIGTESGDIGNYLEYSWEHRWSIDNPSSVDPRLANRGNTYYAGGSYGVNTYWLRSSNYLRLKNLELGYTLPSSFGQKAGISKMRVYVNGFNLFTWDKMKIYDPESTSSSGQYYPQSRIINTGVRVTF